MSILLCYAHDRRRCHLVTSSSSSTSAVQPQSPPYSPVCRWGKYIEDASRGVDDKRRFYWAVITQISMEDIWKPMCRGIFEGYLGRHADSDKVDKVIAKIRSDARTMNQQQQKCAFEGLVAHLIYLSSPRTKSN